MAGAQSFIVLKCRLSGKTRPRIRRNNFLKNFFEDLNGHLRCPKNTDRQSGSMRLSLGLKPGSENLPQGRGVYMRVPHPALNPYKCVASLGALLVTGTGVVWAARSRKAA